MSGQLSKIAHDPSDKEMGKQLTEQYDRATGGMREGLKLGAMMMMLRAHLVSKLDTKKLPTAKASDGGIKKWLEEHARKVQRSTAYRFEDVAKAVQKAYDLPQRVTKELTFEQLVTTDPKKLSEPARKAQAGVYAFVDGTSQKSLLDDYREAKEKGGKRQAAVNAADAEEDPHAELYDAWELLVNELYGRTFGNKLFKAEWVDGLTSKEMAVFNNKIMRVHEHIRETLKARKERA